MYFTKPDKPVRDMTDTERRAYAQRLVDDFRAQTGLVESPEPTPAAAVTVTPEFTG